MKTRSVVLAVVSAVLLAVPMIVAAQENAPKAPEAPAFAPASGNPIPSGGVEVTGSGPLGQVTMADGTVRDLAPLVGQALADVDGAVFTGPCEVASAGGVSFLLAAGVVARCSVAADGTITFDAVKGTVFAQSGEVTLYVEQGGAISATATGAFTDIRGEGRAGSGPAWTSFGGRTPMEDLQTFFRGRDLFIDIKTTGGPVSPFRPVR